MWSSSMPASRSDVPLGRAGGGEDLGAEVAGELDRGHADAAGAGVDQHPLARLQVGEVEQAVEGGGEDDRHAAACSKDQPSGTGTSRSPLGDRERAEGVGDQAHHPVAGGEVARPRGRPR